MNTDYNRKCPSRRNGHSLQNMLTVVALVSTFSVTTTAELIDGYRLGNRLQSIANETLGVYDMQAAYDRITYTKQPVEGPGNIRELADALRAKFQGSITALTRIKNAIENDYENFQTVRSMTQCCEENDAAYDRRFSQEVNFNKACVSVAGQASVNKKFPTSRVLDVMKANFQINPNLKWQYFGGEDGILFNYPSVKPKGLPDCDGYDPRFRPFYVSAATPVPKDVVVVIDTSGSMGNTHGGKTLLQIAKDAANTVVGTLSANDRVGIVSFSSSASTPNLMEATCYTTSLAAATPQNAKNLRKYIDGLRASGSTNYEAAMRSAFSLFLSVNDTLKDKVILFLTDGQKTAGGDPLITIRDQNALLGNQVIILTYGLGQALSQTAQNTLQDMAAQASSNQSYGEVKAGIFKHVTDPDRLRSEMASYYDFFSSTGTPILEPQFSMPYIDLFGTGLITSICLPAYHRGRLIGVACSDVTMSELLSEATYFDKGELSYAFVIDGYARTYSHPLLPRPYDIKDEPIFVDIHHLERASDVKDVVASMIRGEEGNSSFIATRTKARGDVFREGVQVENVLSHFHWAPIPGSNMSVCLVIGDGDEISMPSPQTASPAMFMYHRLDLRAPATPCKYYSRYAAKDSSIVMLTPGAFREPYHYLNSEETSANVTSYERYLRGQTSVNPGLKSSILDSVVITYQAEEIWKKTKAEYVVWRSIGTVDGVLRIFPGIQLANNYDHTRRPWFRRTLTYKGINVISAPYLDLWGSGYVITLSRTIFEGKSGGGHSPNDKALAVMETDFTINYFYQVIQDTYSNCRDSRYSCLVIDSSGYVVMHDNFVEAADSPRIENVHILEKEPVIGQSLVNRNVLHKRSCLDFESIKEQFYWRVSLSSSTGLTSSNPFYEIHPVYVSNVFLIIYNKNTQGNAAGCLCSSRAKSPTDYQCSKPEVTCQCPCYTDANNFNPCRNFYSLLYDSAQTCASPTPDLANITNSEAEKEKILYLADCIALTCSEKSSRSSCFSVAGCSWCSLDRDGSSLTSPFCGSQTQCYFGKLGQACPYGFCSSTDDGNSGNENGGLSGGTIAGIVIGCIVLAVVVFFVWHSYKKGRICASKEPSSGTNGANTAHVNPSFSNAGNPAPPFNPSAPPPAFYPVVDHHAGKYVAPPSYDEIHYH